MFNRKYKKALREIDSEIARYEAGLKSYNNLRDTIKDSDPGNYKGLEKADWYIERYESCLYALRHLRDRLAYYVG